eukprot:6188151-Pleurochrysis_carterae.AAC.3
MATSSCCARAPQPLLGLARVSKVALAVLLEGDVPRHGGAHARAQLAPARRLGLVLCAALRQTLEHHVQPAAQGERERRGRASEDSMDDVGEAAEMAIGCTLSQSRIRILLENLEP